MKRRLYAHLLLVTWCILLALCVSSMRLAADALGAPDYSIAAWNKWTVSAEPLVVAYAAIATFAMLAATYLLIATMLSIVVSLARVPRLTRLNAAITVPAVRRFVEATVTMSIAGTLAVPSVASSQPVADVPVLRHVGAANADWEPPAPISAQPTPFIEAKKTWTVGAGENLWLIAHEALTESLQRKPTNDELTPYWLHLIESNRDVLGDSGSPDLIFPGQVLTLPAFPAIKP